MTIIGQSVCGIGEDDKPQIRECIMRLTVVLITLLLLPTAAYAEGLEFEDPTVFSPTVFDARSRSMGRTGLTMADGSDAIFLNPANIGMVRKKTIQAGCRVWFGAADDEIWDEHGMDVDENILLHPKITHLSFAAPYRPSGTDLEFAFGIGYNTYFDFSGSRRNERSWTVGDERSSVELTTKTHGGLNTISPAAAINIDDKYFFGVAMHKSVLGKVTKEVEHEGENVLEGDSEQEREATGSATFFTVGGTAVLTPGLKVSIVHRTGFEYEFDDVEESWENPDGSQGSADLDDFDYEIPGYTGIGLSYEVSSDFIVAGEIQTRPFSDFELDGADFDWIDDGYCYRIGAEYLTSSMAIRAGVFSDAILAVDATGNDDEAKHQTGFTGGVGFEIGKVFLDLFGEISRWGREYDFGGKEYDYRETHFTLGATATFTIR